MDMNKIEKNQKIGEIVTLLPKAGIIFKKYQIDFCCGGHRLLSNAIEEQNLNEKEILDQLNQAYFEFTQRPEEMTPSSATITELIDLYIMPHHSFTKQILPEISALAGTILKVHGIHHKELFTIHKLVKNLETELEQHLIKEEVFLFPAIKEYEKNPSDEQSNKVREQIEEIEAEHDAAGDLLKELRQRTNQYQVPQDGCSTYEKTFEKIKELESDLFDHIHLENNILFPKFERQE